MNAPIRRSEEPLIHIGYHKTGTTWLQRRIFNDPSLGFTEVWPPDAVEHLFVATNPFTFDPGSARRALGSFLTAADERNLVPVISHERLSGQPLQGSIDSRAIADRLSLTFPRARVLIGIRAQDTMLLSLYKQITTHGLDQWRFRDFLTYRLNDPKLPPVLDVLEYHHLIRYYQGCFGADRVLVLPFESLRDPTRFVGRIAEFAGIEVPTDVPRDLENAGMPSAAVALTRVLNILTRMLGLHRSLSGPMAKPKLVSARRRALQILRGPTKGAISSRVERRWLTATSEYLGGRYTHSNRETERLTGLDLGALGYRVAD